MASSKWKSKEEILEIAKNRSLFFWGASHWAESTAELLNLKPDAVVDQNPLNAGGTVCGSKIISASQLAGLTSPFIVITTASFQSVVDELRALSFTEGEDFCVSPLLSNREAIEGFKRAEIDVLLSSPEHRQSDSTGGGLYRVRNDGSMPKKISGGKGRGLTRTANGFAWVEMMRGIVVFNHNLEEIDEIPLGPHSEPHGLAFDKQTNAFFVGQPGRDSIGVYSPDKGHTGEFRVSDKWFTNGADNHHVNDLEIYDGSLFVSMFSLSGNWRSEIYDGGVVEFDTKTGTKISSFFGDLWMPHSIRRSSGKLQVLDSMRGTLVELSHRISGQFSGFLRGLDFTDRYTVIGQSAHRYPEKLSNQVGHVPLDAGILLFDPETKYSRFVPTPFTETIHSLLVLNQESDSVSGSGEAI